MNDPGNKILLQVLLSEIHGASRGVTQEKFDGALSLFCRQFSRVQPEMLKAAFDEWLDQQRENDIWALPTPGQVWAIIRRHNAAAGEADRERNAGVATTWQRPRAEFMDEWRRVNREAGLISAEGDLRLPGVFAAESVNTTRHEHSDRHPETNDFGRWRPDPDGGDDLLWVGCVRCKQATYRRERIAKALEQLPTPVTATRACDCIGGYVTDPGDGRRVMVCRRCNPDQWESQYGGSAA